VRTGKVMTFRITATAFKNAWLRCAGHRSRRRRLLLMYRGGESFPRHFKVRAGRGPLARTPLHAI
jgi:hypothetical protein